MLLPDLLRTLLGSKPMPDVPLAQRRRTSPRSATLACRSSGVYACTDLDRGEYKAPTEALARPAAGAAETQAASPSLCKYGSGTLIRGVTAAMRLGHSLRSKDTRRTRDFRAAAAPERAGKASPRWMRTGLNGRYLYRYPAACSSNSSA